MDLSCTILSGIEPVGNRVLKPAVFTVDTFSAGQGQVTVYIEDPEGRKEEVKAVLNEGKKTYSVTYIPQVMGPHKVRLKDLPSQFYFECLENLRHGFRGVSTGDCAVCWSGDS